MGGFSRNMYTVMIFYVLSKHKQVLYIYLLFLETECG